MENADEDYAPLLKPVAATILLLTIGGSLHVFDLVKTLTDGGPYHKTETIELFIYQYAFATQFGAQESVTPRPPAFISVCSCS